MPYRSPDDEPAGHVPAWHPEGGAGPAAAPAAAPVPVGVLLATALVMLGLFTLQVRLDGWLGSGLLVAGVVLLLHEVWHWRLPGGTARD